MEDKKVGNIKIVDKIKKEEKKRVKKFLKIRESRVTVQVRISRNRYVKLKVESFENKKTISKVLDCVCDYYFK